MEGKTCGNLLVLKRDENKNRNAMWKCLCLLCGKDDVIVSGVLLRKGDYNIGCGCGRKAHNFVDLTGQKFGMLTVLYKNKVNKHRKATWICSCDCGSDKEVIVCSGDLKNGNIRTCGCSWKDPHNRLPEGEAAFNKIYRRIENRAKKKGLVFDLSKEFVYELSQLSCYYCGCEPNQGKYDYYEKGGSERKNGSFIYNGLDRIDNSKGYIVGNCAPCCFVCNRAKGTLTYEEFKSWVNRLHDRFRHDVVSQDKFSQTVGHS